MKPGDIVKPKKGAPSWLGGEHNRYRIVADFGDHFWIQTPAGTIADARPDEIEKVEKDV